MLTDSEFELLTNQALGNEMFVTYCDNLFEAYERLGRDSEALSAALESEFSEESRVPLVASIRSASRIVSEGSSGTHQQLVARQRALSLCSLYRTWLNSGVDFAPHAERVALIGRP